ncbi:HAMP domain-containing protein [Paenibacillus antri]|uniref:HAMP domain-containing protein n=1 Tax=Paenibacillus antri TaxID=2582848 RepID=A0A5R9G9G1_9BACL|nr:methyl-accepting chemotaxis protein [Paenibacillus antri]TLS49373.1 HAMP domain-containing protein [Paenibacillus antri]
MRQWLLDLNLRIKLISAFVVVACIAAVVGVFGILNMNAISDKGQEMYEVDTRPLAVLGQWSGLYQNTRVSARDVLLSDEPEYKQERADRTAELFKAMEPLLADFASSVHDDEVREVYDTLERAFGPYYEGTMEVVRMGLTGQEEQGMRQLYDMVELTSIVTDASEDLMALVSEQADEKADSNTALSDRSTRVMLVFIAAAMALAIALGMLIARMIARPVQTLVEASRKVADGDLNVNIDIRTKDEIGTLAQAFGAMTDSMNEVLHNIANASEQVASGSRQVSEASQELSQGSTEQASSIQQLTTSMEQIASQTKQNAANAEEANRLALSASADAEQGNGRMKEMLAAMEQINESSGNISKIIKVIDEIAFQTNILALNAAVEAARAGQHGKGFAVVAEEVRNLAARSANAAKETTALIEGSIKKVEAGTKIANDTAAALEKIVGGVGKAAQLVGSIASASNEQAAGIMQANQGIAQVSDVVQANSATSEECAAASEELSGQSEQLKEMVGKFRLKRNALSSGFAGYESYAGLDSNRARFASAYARSEVAAASGKKRVRLDDDFGKYE